MREAGGSAANLEGRGELVHFLIEMTNHLNVGSWLERGLLYSDTQAVTFPYAYGGLTCCHPKSV